MPLDSHYKNLHPLFFPLAQNLLRPLDLHRILEPTDPLILLERRNEAEMLRRQREIHDERVLGFEEPCDMYDGGWRADVVVRATETRGARLGVDVDNSNFGLFVCLCFVCR